MQASQIQHILIEEALITNRHILQVDILAQINSFIFSITLVIANCDYFHIQRNTSITPTLCYTVQGEQISQFTNVA